LQRRRLVRNTTAKALAMRQKTLDLIGIDCLSAKPAALKQ
jgi:hypothetical protein